MTEETLEEFRARLKKMSTKDLYKLIDDGFRNMKI